LTEDEIDRQNAVFVAQHEGHSWEDLLAEKKRAFQAVVKGVEQVPQKAFLDARSSESVLVAACTYKHYEKHINDFEDLHLGGMMSWKIDEIADLCLSIQRVPSPTGAEHERAAFVAEHFRSLGLKDVEIDDAPNVYARVAGMESGGPGLMVSAHLDTVFPEGTDLSSRREGMSLYGPGIGDNSMGVAGLITLAEKIATNENPPACDVWFVANAGEEGLGDLKGMRQAIERLGSRLKCCIILEGTNRGPWIITHRGLGVRRYKIEVKAKGGHSWGAFGEPSAIHELVSMAGLITQWEVPDEPRTTYNIGVIEGGTSVNTIAENASMLLDLRSEDKNELAKLIARTEEIVAAANASGNAVVKATVVSDRPTGEIAVDHPLVAAATRHINDLGIALDEIKYRIGSTDANIPLSQGLPAVTIYLTNGRDGHRLSESLSLEWLSVGMEVAWRLVNWAISTEELGV
jgi:acetylornithine deacetylase/succinyl-diaminopimelate desuccinylase-like protein